MRPQALQRQAFSSKLGKSIIGLFGLILTTCSIVYLVIFTRAYELKLVHATKAEAVRSNALVEAALLPTLMRNDRTALQDIVSRLSRQDNVTMAVVTDAAGNVRLGNRTTDTSAVPISLAGTEATSDLILGAAGQRIVRAVTPLRNAAGCTACHGPTEQTPILGALVLERKADGVLRDTLWGGLLMTLAGATVMLASLYAIASVIARRVLMPVQQLNAAASALADGDFAVQAHVSGDDEMAALGKRFDGMAQQLGTLVLSLRQNEDFLQRVIDAAPDGIRVIAKDFSILKVNAAYCRQLGINAQEALDRSCHLSTHHLAAPCSPRLVTCPLAELSQHGRTSLTCQHRHLKADGSEIFVEVSAAHAQIYHDGRLVDCVIESIRDLGAQVDMSHKYRLAELGQLATGVAHEIHNPLWSIHLALSAIRADIHHLAPPQSIETYFETADKEINRCLSVTDRLLRLSEPSTEQTTIINLAEAVQGILRLVAFEAREAHVTLVNDVKDDLRTIANDSDISIVILNLTQNAIHAMPEGGTLTITGRRATAFVEIEFADTGVGIPPDDVQKIFWPFWSRRADGNPGTGLGLSIVQAIINRLGGSITVSSSQGAGPVLSVKGRRDSGTTFIVKFPDAELKVS